MHVPSQFKNRQDSSQLSSCINPYSLIEPMISITKPFTEESSIFAASIESAYSSSLVFMSSSMSDPGIKAEVLSDLAYVALDLSTFMTPVTVLLRAFSVIGRVMSMGADYIPDHTIRTDDLLLNSAMLAVYFALLGKSIIPVIRGAFVELNDVDEEIYELLFRPVGISKIRFKSIHAASIDYVDVEPNNNISCEARSNECNNNKNEQVSNDFLSSDYLYWLYMGGVETSSEGLPISYFERTNNRPISDPGAMELLGDVRFHNKLDIQKRRKIIMGFAHRLVISMK